MVRPRGRVSCQGGLVEERQAFPHLFAPLQIGPVEVANRLYVTPHGPGYTVPDPSLPGFSLPADNVRDYYVERARGGVGLIIQGAPVVHATSEYPSLWQLFSERAVESWAPIVEAVHQHGTKMFVQLMHGGHHADHFGQFGGPLSSSTVPPIEGTIFGMPYIPLSVPVREMTQDESTPSSEHSASVPATPWRPATTGSSSMPVTATSWRSSCRRSSTSGPTGTAAASRIACGSCFSASVPCGRAPRGASPWACGSSVMSDSLGGSPRLT